MMKLTVGMATYADSGAWFAIQALRMYQPEMQGAELLVVDNKPDSQEGEELRHLFDAWLGGTNSRYIAMPEPVGTAAPRQRIFDEATGDVVLVIDSHVFIAPEALGRLLAWYEEHPGSLDLLSGPVVYDDLRTISTHFDDRWRDSMRGTWGTDERGRDPDAGPFEIPGHGLGLFSCRREAWQGFNPAFRGFGGEELYIHEKFRRAGGRCLCLPFLRWVHKFAYVKGKQRPVKYPLDLRDKVRNYVIGHLEIGLSLEPIVRHFVLGGLMPPNAWNRIAAEIQGVTPPERIEPPKRPKSNGSVDVSGDGPGSELTAIFKALKIASCQRCKELAAKMNRWGPDGCREHRAEIVAELQERAKQFKWHEKALVKARAATTDLVFKVNWTDPFPGLVDEAIRRAEEKMVTV